MTLIQHRIKIIPQTGSNCKSTAIATADATFASDLGFENIPLHKSTTHAFSIRELAKRHRSMQGELLQINQLNSMLSDLGYENNVVVCETYDLFKENIQNSLEQGDLIIACFAVNRETRLPYQYDGGNEHATVIYGINTDTDELYMAHDNKEFVIYARDFYDASTQLPLKREPEYYVRIGGSQKYAVLDNQQDEVLLTQKVKKSITPELDSGFQKKLLVVKRPYFNNEQERMLFLEKRATLIGRSSFREQSIALSDLIMEIKTRGAEHQYRMHTLIPEVRKALSSYSDTLAPIKQQIIDELSKLNPNLADVITQLDKISHLLLKTKSLSQKGCFKRMRAAGYDNKTLEPGQCYGLSQMALNAFLTNDMDGFVNRLNTIQNIPVVDFERVKHPDKTEGELVSRLKLKEEYLWNQGKKNEALALRQQQNNIYAFFDGVILYQAPSLFPDHFSEDRNLVQHVNPARPILSQTGVEQLTTFGMYKKKELGLYLDLIKTHIKKHVVGLSLSSAEHAINLNYDGKKKQWLLIDPNDLPGNIYLNTSSLVDALFLGFFKDDVLPMITMFYAVPQQQKMMQASFKALEDAWSELRQLTPEYLSRVDEKGRTLLSLYFYRHQFEEAKTLIQKNSKIDAHSMRYILNYYYDELIEIICESSDSVKANFTNAFWENGYGAWIEGVWDEIQMLPDLQSVKKFLDSDAKNKKELLHFLVEKKFQFAHELMDYACENNKQNIVLFLCESGIPPSDAYVKKVIDEGNTDVLHILNDNTFKFTPEHLYRAFNAKDSKEKQAIIELLLETVEPNEVMVIRLIQEDNVHMLNLLIHVGFKFTSKHMDAALQGEEKPAIISMLLEADVHPSNDAIKRIVMRRNFANKIELLRDCGFFTSKHMDIALEGDEKPDIISLLLKGGVQPSNDIITKLMTNNARNKLTLLKDNGFKFTDEHLSNVPRKMHRFLDNDIEHDRLVNERFKKLRVEGDNDANSTPKPKGF